MELPRASRERRRPLGCMCAGSAACTTTKLERFIGTRLRCLLDTDSCGTKTRDGCIGRRHDVRHRDVTSGVIPVSTTDKLSWWPGHAGCFTSRSDECCHGVTGVPNSEPTPSCYSPGREVTHTTRELHERCRVLASPSAKQCLRIAVFGGRAPTRSLHDWGNAHGRATAAPPTVGNADEVLCASTRARTT